VSALKAPQDLQQDAVSGREAAQEAGKAPAGVAGWQYGDLKAHGAGSPARKLQSYLAERLHRPHRISVRATLATIAVLCLSMTVAGFYLITFG
jgi:hypothetical protein